MRKYEYIVEDIHEGVQVGHYLMRAHSYSRRVLTKLKKTTGALLLNGEHVRTVDYIKGGDVIVTTLLEESEIFPNCNLDVPIVYEDDDIIIFNKPYDMPVHPARNHQTNTLANAFCGYMQGKGQNDTFRVINRLDRDTTGLCVVAKNRLVASQLCGVMQKEYTAICTGEVLPKIGQINAPIARCNEVGIKRCVDERGQRSVTNYEVTACKNGYSRVRVLLETGRTHQIRVHFAYSGYPLVGDELYGGDCTIVQRHALCCTKVWFTHPITKTEIVFEIPMSGLDRIGI